MKAYQVGRVCVKTAGRDAGKLCAILDEDEEGNVLIEGETRRRYVNPNHLEPTEKTLEGVNKDTTADEIISQLSA
jgi:large subunit ribosomal protein L14e